MHCNTTLSRGMNSNLQISYRSTYIGIGRIALFHYFTDCPGAYCSSTFTNCEAQTLFHRNRRDQLDVHLHVVSRHYHLDSLRLVRPSRHVRRPEVELRPVAGKERRVPS